MIFFILVAIVIVMVLGAIAANMVFKVKKLEAKREQHQQELEALAQEGRAKINASIQVIARATVEGQCEYPEACIRLSALMDQLSISEQEREPFVVFDKYTQKIQHIPILGEWKSLAKNQRQAYREEMEALNQEYQDFIKDAAQSLIGKTF